MSQIIMDFLEKVTKAYVACGQYIVRQSDPYPEMLSVKQWKFFPRLDVTTCVLCLLVIGN